MSQNRAFALEFKALPTGTWGCSFTIFHVSIMSASAFRFYPNGNFPGGRNAGKAKLSVWEQSSQEQQVCCQTLGISQERKRRRRTVNEGRKSTKARKGLGDIGRRGSACWWAIQKQFVLSLWPMIATIPTRIKGVMHLTDLSGLEKSWCRWSIGAASNR